MKAHDLAIPASTNAKALAAHFATQKDKKRLTVIFSTYQSIQVVHEAQKRGVPEFDLIICDEAHRTTGLKLPEEDESHFIKVHDAAYIKSDKRLYMTATPRIYTEGSRAQAKENDIELCSMDDESLFGPEFFRLGFSEAVSKGLLTDYKVLVLAVDEKFVGKAFQRQLADASNELTLDDAVKIVGCWNGLSKYAGTRDSLENLGSDVSPMRRAVAFSRSIRDSQKIVSLFSQIVGKYKAELQDDTLLDCKARHVDGKMNVLERNNALDWLKQDTGHENICRILSNARCLSEGVDVPALDAVMFLNPRNSVVDVVQSVGRVMRRAEGKQYGYIILPVGIPADTTPEKALEDNNRYRVVWQVLQALRAHDDRFNAMINRLDLNDSRPDNLQIIGVGGGAADEIGEGPVAAQVRFTFPELEEWRDAIYAKVVIKCGDKKYWETWAGDIAQIAQRHIDRITLLLDKAGTKPRKAFNEFLAGLRENLNPSISEKDAIEMLAQHLITRPVFDALFEGYSFTQLNPVSQSMQSILAVLDEQAMEKETATLDKFYASVRERAGGVDSAEGKQKIIVELYDKFFRIAFKSMTERLGIVYTPVPVVDFIIRSVNDALKEEFGASLSEKGVHVLDPFTGTGTFIVRLLQSGLIDPKHILQKFRNEIHANEIVLLAYYIAAINIEAACHGVTGGEYCPFDGIVLTDTFQMTEAQGMHEDLVLKENNKRVVRQLKQPIRVIIGNPPYSAQQDSENDNNKNLSYPRLDETIRQSYAAHSNAKLLKNLYDSYIRAIRWASDRIKDRGIVCFVTNGSFIDANNMDGLRKCLVDEYTSIYCFNLRGNQRTSGERSRQEGGKIFGSGSRTPVAITLMIKNPENAGQHRLFYYDIGDYLSREDKLNKVAAFGTYTQLPWQELHPNKEGDWIGHRNEEFQAFLPLGDKTDPKAPAIFDLYSQGVLTARDAWAYNFSSTALEKNMRSMMRVFNRNVTAYEEFKKTREFTQYAIEAEAVADCIENDSKKISWSRALKNSVRRGDSLRFQQSSVVAASYRPFCKYWLCFDSSVNEMVYQMPRLFPESDTENLIISVSGIGASKGFSTLITDDVPNYHFHDTAQHFPRYRYVKNDRESDDGLFPSLEKYTRLDAIPDAALKTFRDRYAKTISKDDIFYYVYGILHSPEYKTRFADDLKKMLPRIPFATDFEVFCTAGRKLAALHLNYETGKCYALKETIPAGKMPDVERYRVRKMTFAKRDGKPDKSTIIFNEHVTLSGVPEETYTYIVNGKAALDWIMERYQVTVDKDSGIRNDPNDWSEDPLYIVDLVKRIVRVSVETMQIVNALPPLGEHRMNAKDTRQATS